MQVEFITSFAPITTDVDASRRLYVDTLGLPLEHAEGDDYLHTEDVAGARHFGVWPIEQAAQACFGTPEWPADVPTPQASIEFELADAAAVGAGAGELRAAGYTLLHEPREEPWGQTVARMLSPDHLVVGLSYAPSLHA